MITGKAAHKEKCNNVAKTIATAAVAVVRAIQSHTQSTPTKQDTIQKTKQAHSLSAANKYYLAIACGHLNMHAYTFKSL